MHAKAQAILVNLCAILLIGAMLLLTVKDLDRELHLKKFFGKLLPARSEQIEETAPVEGESK